MKFSIENFFSKCDQIRREQRIWLHLLKKTLMENFIFVQWNFIVWLPLLLDRLDNMFIAIVC